MAKNPFDSAAKLRAKLACPGRYSHSIEPGIALILSVGAKRARWVSRTKRGEKVIATAGPEGMPYAEALAAVIQRVTDEARPFEQVADDAEGGGDGRDDLR